MVAGAARLEGDMRNTTARLEKLEKKVPADPPPMGVFRVHASSEAADMATVRAWQRSHPGHAPVLVVKIESDNA